MTKKKSIEDLVAGPDYYSDMFDTLGTKDPTWSPNNVKQLLKSLIESKILYEMDDAALLSFLYRNKLLNLSNRHSEFFKSLIPASQTNGGFDAIKKYAYSDSDNPPDITGYSREMITSSDSEKNIEEFSENETSKDKYDPLRNSKPESIQDVIKQTEYINKLFEETSKISSISVDKEAMEFYLNYFIKKYWDNIFLDEKNVINFIKNLKFTGNKFRDTVIKEFLNQYDESLKIKYPPIAKKGFIPNQMQKYVASRVKKRQFFANFSGTGAGKTIAAILASKVINSKNTLIICPNNVVPTWEDEINATYPDSVIKSKDKVFESKYDSTKTQYLILNWDKLNQPTLVNKLSKLGNQKIDFVILDEVHFTKNEDASRRENLLKLLTKIKRKNLKYKLLGMTATPIVNKLQEGKSLLELITGVDFTNELDTKPFVGNAVRLYEHFTNMSVRQLPSYEKARYRFVDVEAPLPDIDTINLLSGRPLAIEQLLTTARIPEIIKRIKGQTIIYTEYVGSTLPGRPTIMKQLEQAMIDNKFSYGKFTGDEKTDMDKFKDGTIQVLIASRPIAVGIDGLQKVCNNLIFNTLPWTNAQYRQVIGRLVRTGQKQSEVFIHHIKARFPGVLYDEIKKLQRINYKKTLADCAVDGKLPEGVFISPIRANKEAIKWLERLERGEVSVVNRSDIEREFTEEEIKVRLTKYGEFSKMNQKINTEKSDTTHKRFTKNPEEFKEYHRQYREQRKTWDIIPYEYWIKRLKKFGENYVIGDFGCGEGKIGQDPQLSSRVKSFDHVSIDDFSKIIPCDMTDVRDYVNDGGLNAVVFSLSLMGKNWKGYLKEAHRCLHEYGTLLISETTNQVSERLIDLEEELDRLGFRIEKKEEKSLFTFIEALKIEK